MFGVSVGVGGSGRVWYDDLLPGVSSAVPPESRLEIEVGGVSKGKQSWCTSMVDARTLESVDRRLKASSITLESSVLTFLTSVVMYLVGLSGSRSRKRGPGLAATLGSGLVKGESPMVLEFGDWADETTDAPPRLEYRAMGGVFRALPPAAVPTVTADEPRI